jgi:hypothetical protein
MSGKVFMSLLTAVLGTTVCVLILIRGPETGWDWFGVLAFGGMAVSFGLQAYRLPHSKG